MKKILPVVLIATFSSSPIFAESVFSGELLLGSYKQKIEFDGESSDSKNSNGIGLRGVWQFHERFAAEVSWQNYGEAKWQEVDDWGDTITAKTEISAITFGIKSIFPINDRFSFNARLGLALWDLDWTMTDSGFPEDSFSISDDGHDIYLGLGGEYQINSNIYAGIAYNYMKTDFFNIDHTISGFQAYLGYRF